MNLIKACEEGGIGWVSLFGFPLQRIAYLFIEFLNLISFETYMNSSPTGLTLLFPPLHLLYLPFLPN